MQIGAVPTRLPPPADLADALARAAGTFGHRPAVTVLHVDRREEQGYASLAQWAAKGAHLLQLDLLLDPGDRVAIVGPPGWLPVAVAHACWWAGVVVTSGPAEVAVVHEGFDAPEAEEVLWFGEAVDGSPVGETPGEPWAIAVQAFPDQPPTPRASADAVALVAGGRSFTHADLLGAALAWGDRGALGLDLPGAAALADWLVAAAVRPMLTGRPTVLLRGASRDDADGEGVERWVTG